MLLGQDMLCKIQEYPYPLHLKRGPTAGTRRDGRSNGRINSVTKIEQIFALCSVVVRQELPG